MEAPPPAAQPDAPAPPPGTPPAPDAAGGPAGGTGGAAGATAGAPAEPAAPPAGGAGREDAPAATGPHAGRLAALALAALGIVFGDIGTSPLYAFRESFLHADLPVESANVLGVLSLIFWALMLIVSVKYIGLLLRADNEGEGGILALMALLHPAAARPDGRVTRRVGLIVLLTLFGAALLYGDGLITPAISVVSAVEGLKIAMPDMGPLVLPLSVVILIGLFLMQHRGTGRVGILFGPVILVWFLVLAALGLRGILAAPGVLAALDPRHGALFLAHHGQHGFFVLGSVFLAVTGAEALYADMGHFGRGPIRAAWFALVLPALLLNYFGQGALLMTRPEAVSNPFFFLAPEWALLPLVLLATLATIIASQAIVAGAFSLTAQAVQMGYFPRLQVRHTSAHQIGQIYVPAVNWAFLVGTIVMLLSFGSSGALAGAYALAVTSMMSITTVVFYFTARTRWGWPRSVALPLLGLFLAIELAFFSANLIKVFSGGWVPLAVAAGVFLAMTTWRKGRRLLEDRMRRMTVPLGQFLNGMESRVATRVRGHAVYMTGNPVMAPAALVQNLRHQRVLHMNVALLTMLTEDVPHVPRSQRVSVESLGHGFSRILARYGFMDEPDVTEVLSLAAGKGVVFPPDETTFFLGRERVVPSRLPGMAIWRERLFAFMTRNATPPTAYFRVPRHRVIEVGSHIEV